MAIFVDLQVLDTNNKKKVGKNSNIKKIEKVPQTFSIFPSPHSSNSLGDCWRLRIKETSFPSPYVIFEAKKAYKDANQPLRQIVISIKYNRLNSFCPAYFCFFFHAFNPSSKLLEGASTWMVSSVSGLVKVKRWAWSMSRSPRAGL